MDLCIHSPICHHGIVLNYLSTRTTLPYYTERYKNFIEVILCLPFKINDFHLVLLLIQRMMMKLRNIYEYLSRKLLLPKNMPL
jgi:hypothetical protein